MANAGIYNFAGMYGAAFRNGVKLTDVTAITGTADANVIDMPLVGTDGTGYKRGRVAREGTMSYRKMDSAWELEVWSFFGLSLEARRAARDAGTAINSTFNIILKNDDPEAGIDSWILENASLWRLNVGFDISAELLTREIPIRWESEKPIDAFHRQIAPNGQIDDTTRIYDYRSGVKQS